MSEKFIPLSNEAANAAKQKSQNPRFSSLLSTTVFLGASLMSKNVLAEEKNAKQLPTVSVIESRYDESYSAAESLNPKMTGTLRDAPRSVTTVTRQLMNDQGITKVSDALRNVPGISLAAGEGGNQGDNLMIRGFSGRNDFFIDGMRDFGNYFRDSFNLENIEVVQGASSILFGRGSAGGVVAQNSKQAYLGSSAECGLMLGTNDLARTTVDVNEKIDGLKGAAIRLNAMAHSSKVAERDYTKNRRAAFAPSVAFGLGTDTRLNVSYLHQNEDNIPDYGVPFLNGEPADVKRDTYYGFKSNDHLKTTVDIATAKFEHDISKDTTLRNQTRYARYYRDVQITEPQAVIDASGATVTRSLKIRKSLETYMGNQTDLTSKFETGSVKHTAVVGLALERETSTPDIYAYPTTAAAGSAGISLTDPFVDSAFLPDSVTLNTSSKAIIDTIGIYALDTVKLNKSFELSLGARFDNLRTNYDQQTAATGVRAPASRTDNVLSYNAGAVYKPAPHGSVYFNHGTSFNPSAESLTLTSSSSTGTNSFNTNPEKNTIYELGTKWDLFKKRLSTTFAIYRSEKDNARETNPYGGNSNQINSSKQRVYGLLAQITGSITEKWKIMTGYSYMDGEITKSVSPLVKNRSLANIPEHTFSLFTTYQLRPDFQFGGGANFVSERYAGNSASGAAYDAASGNFRNVDSYLVFNAMAKYQVSKNVSMQLNANNLTNEYYFDQVRGGNAVVPGEGRTLLLGTNIKF